LTLWDGFLFDPETMTGSALNQGIRTLGQLEETRCLVLLGERGAGKSVAIQQLMEAHPDDPSWQFVDTGQLQTEIRLKELVFDGPEFKQCLPTEHPHHIILDSLDEGPLEIGAKVRLVAQELGRLSADVLSRLRITMVCRTSMWSTDLEAQLRRFWDGDVLGIYELSPLREEDVEKAASDEGVDAEAFMICVRERRVSILAAKPQTLFMLLRQYQKTSELPSTQRELMYEGCLALCEDDRGQLNRQQRLAIAGRLATVTVFSNKAGIWKGKHSSEHTDECQGPGGVHR
jgi:energy-coupling factor transporter ATP-binding protein EcfA2